METYQISKRAAVEDQIKKYISVVWKENKGFFENLFRILVYVSPFFGIGWVPLILSTIGGYLLDLSIPRLGREIDIALGISPGEAPTQSHFIELSDLLDNMVKNKIEAQKDNNLVKQAGIPGSILRGILKGGGIGKRVVVSLTKLLTGLLALYGAASIDDFMHKITKPLREQITPHTEPLIKEVAPESIKSLEQDQVKSTVKDLKEKYNL